MNLDECFDELLDIVASLEEKTIKIKWSKGVTSLYSAEELGGLPVNTILCSSRGNFFLKAWGDGKVWLSSTSRYSNEELFSLLLKASCNGDKLYATSVSSILGGLQQ
jgi:hypothetical protein